LDYVRHFGVYSHLVRHSLFLDVDECMEGTHDCSVNADCVDMDGYFTCLCREGYIDESPDVGIPGRGCSEEGNIIYILPS